MNAELKNSFNYYSIILLFVLNIISQILKQKCSWKRMNKKKITTDMQYLCMLKFLNIFLDIETYINYFMNFIQQFMKFTMLLIKLIKKYSCSWWFSEVENAVQQAWTAYKQKKSAKHLQAVNQFKKKVICRIKTVKFRKKIHKTVTDKNIWWFMHWMKEKNHLFSEFLIIFLLRETVNEVLHCVVISQKKTEMLKKHFFSEKLQTDFNNMKKTVYFSEMKLLSQILAENIQNFMIYQ